MIEKQQTKIKELREKIHDMSMQNNTDHETQGYERSHREGARSRTSSQKRKKRGSSQKRETSSKRKTDTSGTITSILEKEIGSNDYSSNVSLPLEVPYLESEERHMLTKLIDTHISPRDDCKSNIIMIKAVARLRSLNKLCYILKQELSLSNDKIDKVVIKYQKAVEEGAESDRRLIAMQRELSATKYNPNLNSTNLSNQNHDLENTNILFNRKFSQTVDGKLSHTVISYNDSRVDRSNMISPSKDYKSERMGTECDFSRINYSPSRTQEHYENEGSQTRVPKYNNMFNTTYVLFTHLISSIGQA